MARTVETELVDMDESVRARERRARFFRELQR